MVLLGRRVLVTRGGDQTARLARRGRSGLPVYADIDTTREERCDCRQESGPEEIARGGHSCDLRRAWEEEPDVRDSSPRSSLLMKLRKMHTYDPSLTGNVSWTKSWIRHVSGFLLLTILSAHLVALALSVGLPYALGLVAVLALGWLATWLPGPRVLGPDVHVEFTPLKGRIPAEGFRLSSSGNLLCPLCGGAMKISAPHKRLEALVACPRCAVIAVADRSVPQLREEIARLVGRGTRSAALSLEAGRLADDEVLPPWLMN
jgi:hypothetical protein